MANFEKLAEAVIAGDSEMVVELTNQLVGEGVDPRDIINKGYMGGMTVVGSRMKTGEMFFPEVLMSARVMNQGLEIINPLIAETKVAAVGTVVLGTVKGDLHDIGKNLVGMMMKGYGLSVVDLGVDVSPEKLVEAIKEHDADILALSALLTTTMPAMQDTIEVVENAGLRDKVKIIVGGAPVTNEFATQIGADGYAPDASSAAELCRELLA